MKIEPITKRLIFPLYLGGVLYLILMNSLVMATFDSKPAEIKLQWALSSYGLPDRIYGHTLVAADKYLFVFGGWVEQSGSSGISDDIFCAETIPNGDTLAWQRIDKGLKQPAYVHATVVTNNRIYMIGGAIASNVQTSKVYFANIPTSCPANQISWQETNVALPKALERHAAVYYDGVIYVVGGRNGQDGTLNTTYSAILQSDGQVNSWREDSKLDFSIQNHSLLAYNHRLYLIGGRTGSGQEIKSIYFADILAPGVISAWKPLPSEQFLPHTLYSHRALVSDDGEIFVLGGFYSGSVNQVLSAHILENGSLTNWEYQQPLPSSLHWHAATIARNGILYVVGGMTSTQIGNTWSHEYLDRVFYIGAPLSLTKSSDPPGPVHEGDIITYTISYTNTSLTTQTMVLTDVLPFNVDLIASSIPSTTVVDGSTLIWHLGNISPGQSGQVSFRVQVPLLPSLSQTTLKPLCDPTPTPTPLPPTYVLPVGITCNTTRFWANGVTTQPAPPGPYTLQVQIPPGTTPSTMWLLMKGTDNDPPTVGGVPAQLVTTSSNSFGASLWAAEITAGILSAKQATVVTQQPDSLNALFLFNQGDPPFDQAELDDFYQTTKIFTYTLDVPSVTTQTLEVIIPFMDVTYLTDDLLPDSRLTKVTVQFAGQTRTIIANDPNLGNGLLMTQFPFEIGHLETMITTRMLTVTVETEDSIYTLGPRVCRPVYIKNTAWLCSQQAGCISSITQNVPRNFSFPHNLYLPVIQKSTP